MCNDLREKNLEKKLNRARKINYRPLKDEYVKLKIAYNIIFLKSIVISVQWQFHNLCH